MRTVLILVAKDIANFLRNRPALVLTFLVPIALIYVFGWVFGLNGKDGGPGAVTLAVVNESADPAAKTLVDALAAEKSFRVVTTFANPDGTERPLAEADLRPLMHDNRFRFALVVPADLIPQSGFGLHLKVLSNPQNDIETQMVHGLLQKVIFSNVPQLLGKALQAQARQRVGGASLERFDDAIAQAIAQTFGGDAAAIRKRIAAGELSFGLKEDTHGSAATGGGNAPSPATEGSPSASAAAPGSAGDAFSRIVRIDEEQVIGKDVKAPAATRLVGGWAIMFLLFALSNGAAAFFDEKNSGIFQRLLAAPVSRAQILWSRFLFGVLLGLVQLVVLFAAGQLLYGIDITGHIGLLVVVAVAVAAACSAFGMFVAAFTPNAQAASGLATFLVLTMSAAGGAWFPIGLMPEFIQTIGRTTPVYWALRGFGQVLWENASLAAILPTVGVLIAMAAVVMAASIARLNRRRLFA